MLKTHIKEKIEYTHKNWLHLVKNKGRKSDTQERSQQDFTEKLDFLFDVAHRDALEIIRLREDKEFLIDQRTERKMFIASKDKELEKKQQRREERERKEEERTNRAAMSTPTLNHYQQEDLEEGQIDQAEGSDCDCGDEYKPAGRNKNKPEQGK